MGSREHYVSESETGERSEGSSDRTFTSVQTTVESDRPSEQRQLCSFNLDVKSSSRLTWPFEAGIGVTMKSALL